MIETIQERPINPGIRVGAMLIDHTIMTMVAMIFYVPMMMTLLPEAFTADGDVLFVMDFFGSNVMYVAIFGYALYFCKDCIHGRSPAKRLLKLQVVDNKTGLAASPLQCVIRNLFCVLWMIEAVVALTNTSRRIGDRVAGTRLVGYDPAIEKPKLNIVQLVLAIAIGYGLMLLILWSIDPR